MKYPEPTLYAIPFFLVTLAIEPFVLRRARRGGRPVKGFERRDTIASVGLGVASLVFVGLINLGIFTIAERLWTHRAWDLGQGILGWTAAIVGWDFSYYWYHRVEHENRLLWACHVNHHSSRYYNLSTALRQPWTPVAGMIFYPAWALLGVAPWMIMVSGGMNLVYQYWVHTEAIDRAPRWFEAVFNAPSHHRVHHGANPEYLDRNYAGIFIVWDRLFGTFAPERAPVVYGLTKNIESFSLLTIAFHEYAVLARDVWRARGLRERVGIVVHGPAWRPPSLRSGRTAR
jgi:sterol desaturase/sphingolipid hydroxylase (fatty acid hydroxylase superfamily)